MISTRLGYAGGYTQDPTYHDLGGHREAVEVTFDPQQISFDEVLKVYWLGQPLYLSPDPNPRVHLAVMPTNAEQLAAVQRDKAHIEQQRGFSVEVDIVPLPSFWPAEPMHQKFYLQRGYPELVKHLAEGFPSVDAFLASTAAARLNSWITPMGDEDDLHQAAELLGIAPQEIERLAAADVHK